MNIKNIAIFCAVAFALLFLSESAALYLCMVKTNNVSKFNLSQDKIAKDLEGKVVSLMMNQVWPFDHTQNISVSVLNKKASDEYVTVLIDVKAVAALQQEPEKPKEYNSVNPTSNDPTKTPPVMQKLPARVALSGKMKLTYELINNEWYLLSIDNLTLKASPSD